MGLKTCMRLFGLFLMSAILFGGTFNVSYAHDVPAETDAEEEDIELTTASVSAELVKPAHVIVHTLSNNFIVDPAAPLEGPGIEQSSIDMLLGSLATCAILIFEDAAREEGYRPLESLRVIVEGDYAAAGIADGDVDPRIRAIRVMIDAKEITEHQFSYINMDFVTRCPIYTTLKRSAPIKVFNMNDLYFFNFRFSAHPRLGFPEYQVLVQQDDLNAEMGVRVDIEESRDPSNLDREIYVSAEKISHNPFSLKATPTGPFALGESIGMTLDDWLAASGSGTYTVRGTQAEITMNLENLVPNGVYALWCSRIKLTPKFDIVNEPCSAEDGSEKSFQVDAEGKADFTMSTQALPRIIDDKSVSVLALVYHGDGSAYDENLKILGQNGYVQMFTVLPPLSHRGWGGGDRG